MMIKLENLAKDLQNKLEDISYSKYNEDFPQFNITDDVQIYQNRDIKKNNRRFTPGIIRAIPGSMVPSTSWGVFTTSYELEIYGYRDERHKIKEIFREFVNTYNGRQYLPEQGSDLVSGDKPIIITTGDLIMEDFTGSSDGKNESSFVAYINLIFSVFVGGLSAKETSLKIDGIDIPFDEIQYKQDKSLVSNIDYKDTSEVANSNHKLTYELLTFNIPLNINQEVDQLILTRALQPTYNDLFEIEWDLGIGTKTGQYVLRSSFLQYNQDNEAIGILVSFENTDNIQKIYIDGQEVPILSFNFTSIRGTAAFNNQTDDGNMEVLQTNTTYSYGIEMILLYDNTDLTKSILKNIISNELDTSHIITLELDGVDVDFDVILTQGSWDFNERANQTLTCTFVGEKKL